ncbi:hypothetical protein, partial [Winogradskyella sp. A3E31]|uniref:hypothetical protein n=1 Tax=Winogradskyella sp. A3E31 TaxID=3349637 RepID=UPI00398B265D
MSTMDVQNSTLNEGNFLSSKIPKLAFKFLLVVLLFGWSSQSVNAQCDDEISACSAAGTGSGNNFMPTGNGPTPDMAKLYCSNSSAVSNGIINCTTAADTDGCGIDASAPGANVAFTDDTLFVNEGVPAVCYSSDGDLYNYIQWIVFATPENINSVKLQGVGKMDAWAVFHAGSINTIGKDDAAITMEIQNFSTASLNYVEDACSDQNQYKTWINEDAVISDNDINVYFIALMYDVVSNGSINFKVKECDLIDTCEPELNCPPDALTFCEGEGDLEIIQTWLDGFDRTECGNTFTSTISGNGSSGPFDANAETIAALAPGTYTITNTLSSDNNPMIAQCMATIIVYDNPDITTDDLDVCEDGDSGEGTFDLNDGVTDA